MNDQNKKNYAQWLSNSIKMGIKEVKDGHFRACLVAQGYTQIPGVYFYENYPPVVSDYTLPIILLMWLINKWDHQFIDSKKVFLYATL